MLKLRSLVVVCVTVVALTLATPSASNAQYGPPSMNSTSYGSSSGNMVFDRWIDNRRAIRSSRTGVIGRAFTGPDGKLARPQPVGRAILGVQNRIMPWRR